jgi:hypothetical protein
MRRRSYDKPWIEQPDMTANPNRLQLQLLRDEAGRLRRRINDVGVLSSYWGLFVPSFWYRSALSRSHGRSDRAGDVVAVGCD